METVVPTLLPSTFHSTNTTTIVRSSDRTATYRLYGGQQIRSGGTVAVLFPSASKSQFPGVALSDLDRPPQWRDVLLRHNLWPQKLHWPADSLSHSVRASVAQRIAAVFRAAFVDRHPVACQVHRRFFPASRTDLRSAELAALEHRYAGIPRRLV